eukprot:COSAG04_NODE_11350_length_715_cov_0.637987_1_plen_76_part_00
MSALDATATGAIRLAGQQLGVGLTGVPDAEERLKLELQKIVTRMFIKNNASIDPSEYRPYEKKRLLGFRLRRTKR